MRYILFILMLFSFPNLPAQDLNSILSSIDSDPTIPSSGFGFCAINVNTNKIVAKQNRKSVLMPASSLKVITTASALAILGPDYRFKTELQYDGTIVNGILKGNLYLKGYGDPTLGSDQLSGNANIKEIMALFTKAIQTAGITSIEGAIIGDGSFFDSETIPPTWPYNDLGNYYAAGVSGLNLMENMYYLTFQQASSNNNCKVLTVKPEIPGYSIKSEVVGGPAGSGDNAYIYCAPYQNNAIVRGTITPGKGTFTIKGSIPDPPLFAAHQLHNSLQKQNVSIAKQPENYSQTTSSKRKTLYTHHSPTLKKIVERTNLKSVNLYCEALLKVIGFKVSGKANRKAGIKAIKAFWKNRGLNTDFFFLEDGSGLSARNGVSPYFMASLIRKILLDNKSFSGFKASLPIAGRSGSLKKMCLKTNAENNLRAKSGSFRRVRSYTGYVKNKAGELIAFCIMANNFTCTSTQMKKKMEQVMIKLAE